jgi:NAD+ kinase
VRAVGIVPHPQRAAAYAQRAARYLLDQGVEVRLPELAHDLETLPVGLDFVVSLGGDGTMLRTVDLVASEGVAVLGVNLGQLGFLTEIEPPELEEALRRALGGECQISERMVLSVVVDSDGGAAGKWLALNEAVLEKCSSGHLVR